MSTVAANLREIANAKGKQELTRVTGLLNPDEYKKFQKIQEITGIRETSVLIKSMILVFFNQIIEETNTIEVKKVKSQVS